MKRVSASAFGGPLEASRKQEARSRERKRQKIGLQVWGTLLPAQPKPNPARHCRHQQSCLPFP